MDRWEVEYELTPMDVAVFTEWSQQHSPAARKLRHRAIILLVVLEISQLVLYVLLPAIRHLAIGLMCSLLLLLLLILFGHRFFRPTRSARFLRSVARAPVRYV